MYPLAADFGFNDVAIDTMPVSKVRTPLPPVEAVSAGGANCVLAMVKMEALIFLGSLRPKEHDAMTTGEAPEW
jgi:hypothetical protein